MERWQLREARSWEGERRDDEMSRLEEVVEV